MDPTPLQRILHKVGIFGLAHLIMGKVFYVADSSSRTTLNCDRKNKEQEFWSDPVQALFLP